MKYSPLSHELGYTFIRISFGVIFLIFGYGKITSGAEKLVELGNAMALFGITHGYLFWGSMAALTELCAGLAFIFGCLTRLVCLPVIWLLIVAMSVHINKGDSFTVWAFACMCLCITLGFLIGGSGKYSLDYAFSKNHHHN
jgi:putative oxidoreductase